MSHCFAWAVISNAPKRLGPGKIQKHHILLTGKLILTNKKTSKVQLYLEMVPHREINDKKQTPQKEVDLFSFQTVTLSLTALGNLCLIIIFILHQSYNFKYLFLQMQMLVVFLPHFCRFCQKVIYQMKQYYTTPM